MPEAPVPRVFVDLSSASNLDSVREWPTTVVGARLTVPLPEGLTPDLDRVMAVLNTHQVPVWVALPLPSTVDGLKVWHDAVREFIRRYASRIRVLEIVVGDEPADVRRFAFLYAATDARSRLSSLVSIAIGGRDRAAVEAAATTLSPEQAPYVDALAIPGEAIDRAAVQAFHALVPDGKILRYGREPGSAADTGSSVIREALMTIGTTTVASAWTARLPDVLAAGQSLTSVFELLFDPMEPLDPGGRRAQTARRRPRCERQRHGTGAPRSEDVCDLARLRGGRAAGPDRGLAAVAHRRRTRGDRCRRRTQGRGEQLRQGRGGDAVAGDRSPDRSSDAGQLQRGRDRALHRTRRGDGRTTALDRGNHRAPSASSRRGSGRRSCGTIARRRAWSSTSGRTSPIPATTSSPRTATS